MAKKPSIGRQKIKIAKIEIKNNLQVTFSKRRLGLYRKAHELSTLCGSELAIIAFSPAGNVFSFAHPNADYIIDRYMSPKTRNPSSANSNAVHLSVACRNGSSIVELKMQLIHILNELEIVKKRGEAFDLMRKARKINNYWWESPIDELGLSELEQLRDALEELRKNVIDQTSKFLAEAAAKDTSIFPLNDIAAGFCDDYESKQSRVTVASANPNNIYNNGVF